jgi:hypothetical protein
MKRAQQPTEKERAYIEKNLDLLFEFEKYVLEHPRFAERIPDNALIVMQIEGDEEFNQWSRKLEQAQAEKDQTVVYIIVKQLAAVRSRIKSSNYNRLYEHLIRRPHVHNTFCHYGSCSCELRDGPAVAAVLVPSLHRYSVL